MKEREMRAIHRGASPRLNDYDEYRDSFTELSARLGMYCSYCERRIATQLAVEHIQPKALLKYRYLQGKWENFLLGCVNCNSTKGKKDVVLSEVLLPDRDNTSAAYKYTPDGRIEIADTLTAPQQAMAGATLKLTGLDKRISEVYDSAGELVAIDRVAQRMETWLIAESSKDDLQANPSNGFRRQIVRTARAQGFFSIWMTVFGDDLVLRRMLIEEFPGTAGDCFDPNTTQPIIPRPPNTLANGCKV